MTVLFYMLLIECLLGFGYTMWHWAFHCHDCRGTPSGPPQRRRCQNPGCGGCCE